MSSADGHWTNLVYVSLEIKYTYRYRISHVFKLSPASARVKHRCDCSSRGREAHQSSNYQPQPGVNIFPPPGSPVSFSLLPIPDLVHSYSFYHFYDGTHLYLLIKRLISVGREVSNVRLLSKQFDKLTRSPAHQSSARHPA